jgi:hypothetical protein
MITNNTLLKELKEIKSLLKKDITIDEKDLKYDEEVIELLKKQHNLSSLKFNNIMSWKLEVWDNCKYREKLTKKKEIDYYCRKSKKPCRFEDCPSNK